MVEVPNYLIDDFEDLAQRPSTLLLATNFHSFRRLFIPAAPPVSGSSMYVFKARPLTHSSPHPFAWTHRNGGAVFGALALCFWERGRHGNEGQPAERFDVPLNDFETTALSKAAGKSIEPVKCS